MQGCTHTHASDVVPHGKRLCLPGAVLEGNRVSWTQASFVSSLPTLTPKH